MRVWMDPRIRANGAELARLVREGFTGVATEGVEVRLELFRRPGASFSGRAYLDPPSRPRPAPGTRWLIRLQLPSVLRNRGYPRTYRYAGRTTAPWITVRDWRERLVALVAHEACHVRQFREGLRRSEIQAERWAALVLEGWTTPAIPGLLEQLEAG